MSPEIILEETSETNKPNAISIPGLALLTLMQVSTTTLLLQEQRKVLVLALFRHNRSARYTPLAFVFMCLGGCTHAPGINSGMEEGSRCIGSYHNLTEWLYLGFEVGELPLRTLVCKQSWINMECFSEVWRCLEGNKAALCSEKQMHSCPAHLAAVQRQVIHG